MATDAAEIRDNHVEHSDDDLDASRPVPASALLDDDQPDDALSGDARSGDVVPEDRPSGDVAAVDPAVDPPEDAVGTDARPDGEPAPDLLAAAPAVARETTLLGRRGRYRLGELLGRGGASSVHRGWDRVLNRPVALKLLTYEVQPPPDDRHREARLVAALDHPGLVPVYDVSHLDGHDAVVMPLVEGPSLAARLRENGPLSLVEMLRMGAEVAAGLAHVHAHGVVHRDVKPANILLGPRGARLTDFGIARAPGTTTLTGDGMILGTAAYLAPEQLRDDEVTPAVDVFALGLVLLESLTGRSCYPASPAACATRIDTCPDVPDDLPASVDAAIRSFTTLHADARPSAAEVAVLLARLADAAADGDERTLEDAPAPAPSSAPVPFGRAVVALLLVGAMVAAVLALLNGRPDVALPVVVAAVVAQGALVWRTGRPGGAPSSDPGANSPPEGT